MSKARADIIWAPVTVAVEHAADDDPHRAAALRPLSHEILKVRPEASVEPGVGCRNQRVPRRHRWVTWEQLLQVGEARILRQGLNLLGHPLLALDKLHALQNYVNDVCATVQKRAPHALTSTTWPAEKPPSPAPSKTHLSPFEALS
jgi:hypothetical protein